MKRTIYSILIVMFVLGPAVGAFAGHGKYMPTDRERTFRVFNGE